MANKILYIFVEGVDDKRFFERIIKPMFDKNYDSVVLHEYRQQKEDYVIKFLKSIKSMGADYIYVRDINSSPCVTAKKGDIKDKLKTIDENKVIVVIKEIESWYLAGLSEENVKKFKINQSKIKDTDSITKEQFNKLIPEKFKDSRINFMIELLEHFSIETGKQRNMSFKYFSDKYIG